MWPDSWGVLVWAGRHSGASSVCVTSGLLSLSTSQFGVQLYKNYQQTLCRHLCPPSGGSPPLVSVHRVLWEGEGRHPGPMPGMLRSHLTPLPSCPTRRGVSQTTPWWPWTSPAMPGVSLRTPGKL